MRITVLGSGTSTGVPVPGCRCAICCSADKKNERLRTSIFIEIQSRDIGRCAEISAAKNEVVGRVLVDTSTDLRYQALRAGITEIDAALYTHAHADHISGIDDLRCFNFTMKRTIPVYASEESADELERIFRYAFFSDPKYEGGAPPKLILHRIQPYEPLTLCGIDFIPLPVKHGGTEVFGYRVGKFAYITDCSYIPDESRKHLYDLDSLILDGLRDRPHKTHFSHTEAVAEIEKIHPAKSYLTHLTHEVDYKKGNEKLRKMTDLAVELAYDGLIIEI